MKDTSASLGQITAGLLVHTSPQQPFFPPSVNTAPIAADQWRAPSACANPAVSHSLCRFARMQLQSYLKFVCNNNNSSRENEWERRGRICSVLRSIPIKSFSIRSWRLSCLVYVVGVGWDPICSRPRISVSGAMRQNAGSSTWKKNPFSRPWSGRRRYNTSYINCFFSKITNKENAKKNIVHIYYRLQNL